VKGPLAPRALRPSSSRRSTARRYRPLDEDDDEANMLKIKNRAGPYFDMKKILRGDDQDEKRDDGRKALTPGTRVAPGLRVKKTGMNVPLIRALLVNQSAILTLASIAFAVAVVVLRGFGALFDLNEIFAWSGFEDLGAVRDSSLTLSRILWGIGGAVPLLAFSNAVENSDRRAFANVNFSTITLVMTLFGRRSPPPPEFLPPKAVARLGGNVRENYPTTKTFDVVLQSLTLSSTAALCEETVFRRYASSILSILTNGNLSQVVVGQALLFGLGHANPKSGLAENAITVGLQTVTGLGFGAIYLASGGDLVPCIVAHAVFDFVTFLGTWTQANRQLEYAERRCHEPLPGSADAEVRRILSRSAVARRTNTDPRLLYNTIKRLFYIFDFDEDGTLSLSEVRKGIAYMSLERGAGIPPPNAKIDELFDRVVAARGPPSAGTGSSRPDRLDFADFVRLYSTMMGGGEDGGAAAAAGKPANVIEKVLVGR